ncbi:MAG: hypothetical protein LBG16_03515 [Elusimicrobiota bacterium]|nr:hypothetical protein [Elusimicrobiota bacterium]
MYLEKAISPRAQPLFKLDDINKYQMDLFKPTQNPRISLGNRLTAEEETSGIANPL